MSLPNKFSIFITGVAAGGVALYIGQHFRLLRLEVRCPQIDRSIEWVQRGETLDAAITSWDAERLSNASRPPVVETQTVKAHASTLSWESP
jgi:hypothetical protein